MSDRTQYDVLLSICRRAGDAIRECNTFRLEAIYRAEQARRTRDFEAESHWRQEASAWSIQARHHSDTRDALAGFVADEVVNTAHEMREPRPQSVTKRLHDGHQDMHA